MKLICMPADTLADRYATLYPCRRSSHVKRNSARSSTTSEVQEGSTGMPRHASRTSDRQYAPQAHRPSSAKSGKLSSEDGPAAELDDVEVGYASGLSGGNGALPAAKSARVYKSFR